MRMRTLRPQSRPKIRTRTELISVLRCNDSPVVMTHVRGGLPVYSAGGVTVVAWVVEEGRRRGWLVPSGDGLFPMTSQSWRLR